jgi:hypothetical protein
VPASSWAQIPIFLSTGADDPIGKQFNYRLHEQLAKSALFDLKAEDDVSAEYGVHIIAADHGAHRTNYSATVVRSDACGEVVVGIWLAHAGSLRVSDAVDVALASIFEAVTKDRVQRRQKNK